MIRRRGNFLLFAFIIAGCGDAAPSIIVSGVQIVAPAPGRAASVAYLTISNRGSGPVSIQEIESPQFERVELHETVLDDGIASMRPLGASVIAPGNDFAFKPGGRHVMLLEPTTGIVPGNIVTLQVHFTTGEMLIVQAPVSTRVSIDRDK